MTTSEVTWERLYAQYRLLGAAHANMPRLRVLLRKDDAWEEHVTDVLLDRQLDVLMDVLEAEGLK